MASRGNTFGRRGSFWTSKRASLLLIPAILGIVLAVAGQAVGPVLSGGVQGSAGLTTEQAIVLATNSASTTVAFTSGHTGDDSLITVNDEGTAFTAAIEMHIGDTATIQLDIDNVSDASANAVLELNVPKGIDIEVEEVSGSSGIEEAQLTRNSWLMRISNTATGQLGIIVSPKDDLKPGFYSLTGRIVQVAN